MPGFPQHAIKVRVKNKTDRENGIKVHSVSVLNTIKSLAQERGAGRGFERTLYVSATALLYDYKFHLTVIVRKRAKIRNRYNQAPHMTQDTKWESDNVTIRHHKREPRCQPFPTGDHKASTFRRA